jgi:hypothetical protein
MPALFPPVASPHGLGWCMVSARRCGGFGQQRHGVTPNRRFCLAAVEEHVRDVWVLGEQELVQILRDIESKLCSLIRARPQALARDVFYVYADDEIPTTLLDIINWKQVYNLHCRLIAVT